MAFELSLIHILYAFQSQHIVSLSPTQPTAAQEVAEVSMFADGLAYDASSDTLYWAVSYTHLDVYKRQRLLRSSSRVPSREQSLTTTQSASGQFVCRSARVVKIAASSL